MYKINNITFALEVGDNLTFVRDGGGKIQIFLGDTEAMKSHDPDKGPSIYTEQEMIVLEVRSESYPAMLKKDLDKEFR